MWKLYFVLTILKQRKKSGERKKNVNEVMYEAGYSDTKAFRTIFKRITGLSPINYRNKYNKDAGVVGELSGN